MSKNLFTSYSTHGDIHFHGGPMWGKESIGPNKVITCKEVLYKDSCALVSYARMDQLKYILGAARCVWFDNGAFKDWNDRRRGKKPDGDRYQHWLKFYLKVLKLYNDIEYFFIPDVIEGSEEDNDRLINQLPEFMRDLVKFNRDVVNSVFPFLAGSNDEYAASMLVSFMKSKSIPVWHSVESLDRLSRLCREWPIVAFGLCGPHYKATSKKGDARLREAFYHVYCSERIDVKIHGLRMLDGRVLGKYPFHTADSSFVATNVPKTESQMSEVQCKLARTAIYKSKIEKVLPPTVEAWVYAECGSAIELLLK